MEWGQYMVWNGMGTIHGLEWNGDNTLFGMEWGQCMEWGQYMVWNGMGTIHGLEWNGNNKRFGMEWGQSRIGQHLNGDVINEGVVTAQEWEMEWGGRWNREMGTCQSRKQEIQIRQNQRSVLFSKTHC